MPGIYELGGTGTDTRRKSMAVERGKVLAIANGRVLHDSAHGAERGRQRQEPFVSHLR